MYFKNINFKCIFLILNLIFFSFFSFNIIYSGDSGSTGNGVNSGDDNLDNSFNNGLGIGPDKSPEDKAKDDDRSFFDKIGSFFNSEVDKAKKNPTKTIEKIAVSTAIDTVGKVALGISGIGTIAAVGYTIGSFFGWWG